ncbi:myelin and lymphocyte protein-like [Sebastes fasciatus]|uniref:myelin and lymphocyte protein-like n=1 Tax=Sebastes fasciatus TaxID=394691 RepID=UPI003D9ECFA1
MTRHRDEEEAEMAATTAQPMGNLPRRLGICTTAPDIFYLPELVFGGLVWILMASTLVPLDNPMGWVMFVSVFCFVVTTVWFFIFLCGANQSSVSPCLDVAYHFVAVVFYLSASVFLTLYAILSMIFGNIGLEFAAMVMSYVATLLYFLHAIFSAIRCSSSKKTTRIPKEKKPNNLLIVGLNTE